MLRHPSTDAAITAASKKRLPRGSAAQTAPLYRQLVEALRKNILNGVYPVGDHLPAEAELSATFQVSRHTVREALRQLRADGLISSRQGAGSTVTGAGSPQAFVHEVGAISDLIHYAASMTFTVEHSEIIEVDAALAKLLQTQPGTKWLRVEGRRHSNSDGALVSLTTVYVPMVYGGVVRLVGRASGAVYELIEAMYGVRIAEVDQAVHARVVPPAAAQTLGVVPDSTVIEVTRVYRIQSGETAEVAVNLYPPERFSMTMKLRKRS